MLDQIQDVFLSKTNQKNKELVQTVEKLDQLIVKKTENSLWEARQDAYSALQFVENEVNKMIENKNLSDIYKEVSDLAKQKNEDIKEQKKIFYQELKKRREEIFKKQLLDNKKFIKEALGKHTTEGIDSNDVKNNMLAYFDRNFAYKLGLDEKEPYIGQYVLRMAGYYREMAEYEILKKQLEYAMNIMHSGGKKGIKGRETESDIMLSVNIDDIKEAFEYQANISIQISSLDDFQEKDLINSITKNVQVFGEQIKSWSLAEKARAQGYAVGHRADLLKTFEKLNNEYSWQESVRFLSQFKNILLTFGPSTVLFSTGKERFWMCDFIHSFRMQGYNLTFAFNKEHKATSLIILDQFYTSKKRLLKRYSW